MVSIICTINRFGSLIHLIMTENLLTYSLTVFTGFFAIMNPIANTPIFLGLVGGMNKAEKKKIAKKASITAFIIVVAFIILGKFIFEMFGITIPAFRITGGILIFYVGFEMLQSKKSKLHYQEHIETDDGIAISPLAIPIFAIMIGLTYLAFRLSDLIVKKIGDNLITVIGKIMGLILAIMGTGMTIDGIKLAFNL